MEDNQKKLYTITFLFISFIFLLTISLYYISIYLGYKGLAIPLLGGGDDGVFYYKNALEIKNGGNAIITSIHVLVLGYIFKIFDTEYIFYLKLFNFLGIIFFVVIHYMMIKILEGKNSYQASYFKFMILICCYISFLYTSTISILRDIWIIDFFSLSTLFLICYLKSKHPLKFLYIIPLIISCIMLFNYRDYALLSFIGGVSIFLFFNRKNFHFNTTIVVIFIVIIFGVYYTLFKNLKLPIIDMSLLDGLKYRREGQELYFGGSQLNIVLDQPNYILFLINYIYSLISNAIGPLPNQISGFGTVVIFFTETIPMSIILIKIYSKRKVMDYYDRLLLTLVFVWFLFIGITNDNLGTASRLRMLAYVLILIVFVRNQNKVKEDFKIENP